MKPTRTYAGLALALLACGTPDAAESPSWTADVRPILAANCVRCHGYPAIGGAPTSFRLDRYEDTITDDGRVILGAAVMSEFIIARVAAGTMPPRYELPDWQVQTLQNWYALRPPGTGQTPPAGAPPADNQPPTMRLLRSTQDPATDSYILDWEIRDPDHDIVGGRLLASGPGGQVIVTRELHAGRGTLVWDAGVVPAGSYTMIAELDDGGGPVEVSLGELPVEHPGGNVAPRVRLAGIGRHSIVADRDSPIELLLLVDDPDAGDTHVADVIAELGDQRVVIAEELAIQPGQTSIPWDTTAVPEGDEWRITATVTDGRASRSAAVEPVVISHVTTDLVYFDDIDPIFQLKCIGCHPGTNRVPRVPWDFSRYAPEPPDDVPGVYALRGLIYWRVIRQHNMPPVSAALFSSSEVFLTDDERARLEEWLLAGAPE